MVSARIRRFWGRFWMRYASAGPLGRVATRFACWCTPPFYGRQHLGMLNNKGFVSPSACIYHNDLGLNVGVFIDDRVFIYQDDEGGSVRLGRQVFIYRDTTIQTGRGGSVAIGACSTLQPRCQLSAYKGSIRIGSDVHIAPNCAFYPYGHGIAPGEPIGKQPLQTKGDIIIEDGVWIGVGVIVLDGVRIGKGAVIGAGSVVTHDVKDGAIAIGVPARVVRMRAE